MREAFRISQNKCDFNKQEGLRGTTFRRLVSVVGVEPSGAPLGAGVYEGARGCSRGWARGRGAGEAWGGGAGARG